jgi:hypothetical protein
MLPPLQLEPSIVYRPAASEAVIGVPPLTVVHVIPLAVTPATDVVPAQPIDDDP